MSKISPVSPAERDYSTISPSAKALLLMKGYTDIPFAKEAAELIMYPEKYTPDFSLNEVGFWARVLHFEARYKSINQLIPGSAVKNILEISSGFSFRGLDAVKQCDIHYIDTDLPEVIRLKKTFVDALTAENYSARGKLEVFALNALEKHSFEQVVARFPAGAITIVNEGLLMYLDMDEKRTLCKLIHKTLKQRGGCWITADIYVKKETDMRNILKEDDLNSFFAIHKIEENKFESFESAEEFFAESGFVIDKEARTDHSNLSSLNYFIRSASEKQMEKIRNTGRIRTTWRLKVKE